MKQAIHLGLLSAVNIALTFLFQWYALTSLGAGVETDALFSGMTVPQLVLAVISGSLMHVLVPLLAGESEKRLRHDAWAFMALVVGLFGILAIFLYVLAPWWVPLIVPGFDAAGQKLTVNLTRIQLIGMVFTAINGVQWAAYHARQQFFWPEFTPMLASAFAFALLIWALPRFGVVAAAWISVLRMALQALLLAPGLGMPVRPDIKSIAVRQAWQRIKPLLLGTAYYKTDPLVDRFLLSMASSGSLSLYYLAQQIYGAVNQVINKAIAAPMVPLLSELYKQGDRDGFSKTFQHKLILVGVIGGTGIGILVLFGQFIINLLASSGNIKFDNFSELWWVMIMLGGMFIGGAMGQITSSTFYACGDTVTPTRMSIKTYTAYIPSKIIAYILWGVTGLAIATSIYYIANVTLQIYLLTKKFDETRNKS